MNATVLATATGDGFLGGIIAFALLGAFVAAGVGSVVGAVAITVARRVGYSTRDAAMGFGGVVAALIALGGGWFALSAGWTAVFPVSVAVVGALYWGVLPLAAGRAALSRLTDADDPLALATYGWPVATAGSLAVLMTGVVESGVGILALAFVVPVVGPTAIGYAIRQVQS